MFSLPNIFTLSNLLCGCIAMFGIFYESTWVVIISFGLALVFDFLDGFTARITGQTSVIGAELDSLADLVSFGVMPTFLLVDIIERSIEISEWPVYGLVFLLAGGAAIRLARFNHEKNVEKEEGFLGMPTPAMALIAFGIWINLDNAIYPTFELLADPTLALILALILAIIMNIPLRFIKFTIGKEFSLHQVLSIILILIFLGGLIINWRLAVLFTSVAYVVLSLLLPLFVNTRSR